MSIRACGFDSHPGYKPLSLRIGVFYFMEYFVYILYSQKFDRFYKGQTNDLEDRLKRHNAGYEKSTAPFIPWKLVWKATKPNRNEALILEKKLKNLSKKKTLEFIYKHSK